MKSRFCLIIILLVCSVYYSSSVSGTELKIIPHEKSGLDRSDFVGVEVTLTGESTIKGKLNEEGFLANSKDEELEIAPGVYTLSFSIKGYKPFSMEVIFTETPEGADPLTVSRKIFLTPENVPNTSPGGGGFLGTGRSFLEDENFWDYMTILLVFLIILLGFSIFIVLKRKREASINSDSVSTFAVASSRFSWKITKPRNTSVIGELEPALLPDARFTGLKFGHYQVRRRVAKGGMAYIVEADFKKDGRTKKAALKIPYDNYQMDEEYINRFNQEAELGDILLHKNIIKIYEYGVTETGVHFIAMEYIKGTDLRNLLKKEKIIQPKMAVRIVIDIAEALDYAHGQDPPVYHRDIKPENIMFRDKKGTGLAVLTDFGIATQGGTMGTGKALIGTALYSCPDVARGYPISPGYDIYSLGVVLYEMLTGEVPFSGADFYTIMRRHEEEEMKPPCKRNPDVPVELEAIVFKMMEKDPKKRFKTAKELLKTLRDYLNR